MRPVAAGPCNRPSRGYGATRCSGMRWQVGRDSRGCYRESLVPAGRGLQPVDSDFSNPKC